MIRDAATDELLDEVGCLCDRSTKYVARTKPVVSMVDVDAVQVHFASYFRWMDLGYDQLLRQLGRPLSSLFVSGWGTPAVDATCNFRKAVTLDDALEADSWISDTGASTYLVRTLFRHEGAVVAVGALKHVWVSTGPPVAPAPLPQWLVEASGRSR